MYIGANYCIKVGGFVCKKTALFPPDEPRRPSMVRSTDQPLCTFAVLVKSMGGIILLHLICCIIIIRTYIHTYIHTCVCVCCTYMHILGTVSACTYIRIYVLLSHNCAMCPMQQFYVCLSCRTRMDHSSLREPQT